MIGRTRVKVEVSWPELATAGRADLKVTHGITAQSRAAKQAGRRPARKLKTGTGLVGRK